MLKEVAFVAKDNRGDIIRAREQRAQKYREWEEKRMKKIKEKEKEKEKKEIKWVGVKRPRSPNPLAKDKLCETGLSGVFEILRQEWTGRRSNKYVRFSLVEEQLAKKMEWLSITLEANELLSGGFWTPYKADVSVTVQQLKRLCVQTFVYAQRDTEEGIKKIYFAYRYMVEALYKKKLNNYGQCEYSIPFRETTRSPPSFYEFRKTYILP